MDAPDPGAVAAPRLVAGKRTEVHVSVARVTEITSESSRSFEDAIKGGIKRANATLRNVSGAWVKEQQVAITDGKISGYRVNMLITFILDDAPARPAAAATKAMPAAKAPARKPAARRKAGARRRK